MNLNSFNNMESNSNNNSNININTNSLGTGSIVVTSDNNNKSNKVGISPLLKIFTSKDTNENVSGTNNSVSNYNTGSFTDNTNAESLSTNSSNNNNNNSNIISSNDPNFTSFADFEHFPDQPTIDNNSNVKSVSIETPFIAFQNENIQFHETSTEIISQSTPFPTNDLNAKLENIEKGGNFEVRGKTTNENNVINKQENVLIGDNSNNNNYNYNKDDFDEDDSEWNFQSYDTAQIPIMSISTPSASSSSLTKPTFESSQQSTDINQQESNDFEFGDFVQATGYSFFSRFFSHSFCFILN